MGRRVLIAENDAEFAAVVLRILGASGWDATCVQDGLEAVECWQRARATHRPFDAVVLDHKMPLLSGLEVADRILGQRPGEVVVVFTGYVTEEVTAQAAQVGARACVAKTELESLPRLLEEWSVLVTGEVQ